MPVPVGVSMEHPPVLIPNTKEGAVLHCDLLLYFGSYLPGPGTFSVKSYLIRGSKVGAPPFTFSHNFGINDISELLS